MFKDFWKVSFGNTQLGKVIIMVMLGRQGLIEVVDKHSWSNGILTKPQVDKMA